MFVVHGHGSRLMGDLARADYWLSTNSELIVSFMVISVRCAQKPPPRFLFANIAAEHYLLYVCSNPFVKERVKQ